MPSAARSTTWCSRRWRVRWTATCAGAVGTRATTRCTPSCPSACAPTAARASSGNEVSGLKVALPLGEDDPLERFARVHQTMEALKGSPQALGASAAVDATGLVSAAAFEALTPVGDVQRYANLVITNVPGPTGPALLPGPRARGRVPVRPAGRQPGHGRGGGQLRGHARASASRPIPRACRTCDELAPALHESLAELAAAARSRRNRLRAHERHRRVRSHGLHREADGASTWRGPCPRAPRGRWPAATAPSSRRWPPTCDGAVAPELVEADVTDRASVRAVAESARVAITTVGPYLKHGDPLVAACAAAGTDYVDLTGEPEFVDRSYVRHHAAAEKSGARLVHACGFDSIPHDLGALFTVEAAARGRAAEGRGLRARRRHLLRRHLPLGADPVRRAPAR